MKPVQRLLWFSAGVGLLLMALVLAWPGVMGDLDRYERIRARVERLQADEGRMRELVISLRHGIANNYDEGNAWVVRIREQQVELAQDVAGDAVLGPLWRDYHGKSQQALEQWERFKLGNAVLRNSLRYFQSGASEFAETLPDTGEWEPLHHDLMRLSQTLYMQGLGEAGGSPEEAKQRLGHMHKHVRSMPAALRRGYDRLVSHARVVVHYSLGLEQANAQLVDGPGRAALVAFIAANQRLLLTEQAAMTRYRAGLSVGVLALFLALGALAYRYLAERRQRDRDLRLASTVFASSQQGVLITDAQGNIVRVNDAYCHITGYGHDQLLGRNPRMLKSGQQDAAFYVEMWQTLKSRGHWQGELRNRRQNGELYVQWTNIEAVHTSEGEDLFVGIATDITELVESRERLARLAYFDPLTDLPNRALLFDRLHQGLAQSRREHESLALIYADLDNFKTVNDTLGHAAGDELLVQVAERLRACVREADTVARLGGDEFALVLMDAKGPEAMARVAEHILHALGESFQVHGLELPGGVSLGITFWPQDGDSAEVLLRNADVAMYRAKAKGRNNFQFFTGDMAAGVAEALKIESGLRRALLANELSLHYQPQIDVTGRVVGAEALMRWNSPDLGWVPPARFIPVAEKSGLIAELGDFALREAGQQCAQWRATLAPDLRVSVNLSAAQFRHEGLTEYIAAVLHEFNLPGSALELEVTESVVMEDVTHGQDILAGFKRLGCRLAIDDFGTGYSSLAYLRRFPVDVLKIDKSFVDGLGVEGDDTAVARAIFSLAQSLRLEVVAEGVETAVQLEALRSLAGEDGFLAQGYFFAPPLPAAEFTARYPSFRQMRLVSGDEVA